MGMFPGVQLVSVEVNELVERGCCVEQCESVGVEGGAPVVECAPQVLVAAVFSDFGDDVGDVAQGVVSSS